MEAGPGPGRGQRGSPQAGRADPGVHPRPAGSDRRPAPAGRPQRRQRLRGRGGQAAGSSTAHPQGRLHRRNDHRPPDHAVRVARTSSRSRWSSAARARTSSSTTSPRPPGRLLRQGAGGLRDVRAQPGRGLHLPVTGADPVRPSTTTSSTTAVERTEKIKQGHPLDTDTDDGRPGLQRPAREDPVLHRHRSARRARRSSPGARRPTSAANWPAATTSSRPSSRATTRCGSSRRRSSARWCR